MLTVVDLTLIQELLHIAADSLRRHAVEGLHAGTNGALRCRELADDAERYAERIDASVALMLAAPLN